MREFGDWLAQERQRFGWSQSDLARASGVKQATISELESGQGRLEKARPQTVAKLAVALDRPIADLLRAAGVETFAELDTEIIQLAYDLQRLPARTKRELLPRLVEMVRNANTSGSAGNSGESHT